MEQGKSFLGISRIFGYLSACLFCLASLAVLDGLQTITREDFNQIDVLAGETITFTGTMPSGKTSIEDVILEVEPATDVSLKVMETFTGFWLGGNQWRAELTVPVGTPQQTVTATIVDIWTDTNDQGVTTSRQNPTLIYPLHIWANADAKNQTSNSYFLRMFGVSPFFLCALCAVFAVTLGVLQWYNAKRGCALLAQSGFSLVHGTKVTQNASLALFTPIKGSCVVVDAPITLYDRQLAPVGAGNIVEVTPQGAVAQFARTIQPRYGWFLRPGK